MNEIQALQDKVNKLEKMWNEVYRPDYYVFERPVKGGAKGLKVIGSPYGGTVAGASGLTQALPAGWSASGTSGYTVTHNLNTLNYAVVAVAIFDVNNTWACVTGYTLNTFTVNVSDKGGANINGGFSFILTLF